MPRVSFPGEQRSMRKKQWESPTSVTTKHVHSPVLKTIQSGETANTPRRLIALFAPFTTECIMRHFEPSHARGATYIAAQSALVDAVTSCFRAIFFSVAIDGDFLAVGRASLQTAHQMSSDGCRVLAELDTDSLECVKL